MKKYFILFTSVFLILSCKGQQNVTSGTDPNAETYQYAFKFTYFEKLLQVGFNNSPAIKEVLSIDRSGYGEPILSMEDYNLIDSLVSHDNRQMIQDSLNRKNRVAEGAQGKRIFDFALSRYQSQWLDSLSRERYLIYKRSEQD